MVKLGTRICPNCGGELHSYGSIQRKLRVEFGDIRWVRIRRLCCERCHSTHRELPGYILPFKQYRGDIVKGFIDGRISEYDIEYEDYPCMTTIRDWRSSHKNQPL